MTQRANADEALNPNADADDSDLVFSYSSPDQPKLKQLMIRAIERASGQNGLRKMYYREISGAERSHIDFYDLAIAAMRLDVRFDAEQLSKVPPDGPVVFVANHPYGVLDGITLTWLAKKVRPDVKVLAHSTLCQIPKAKPNLLPIDFANTEDGQRTTLSSRVAAQKWLRQGGAVGIFPGGGVSTSLKPLKGPAVDPPWHPFTAKMIKGAKATVIPICFGGQNSRLFQLASHISYTLRQALMFHETARRRGTRVEIGIGDPIPYSDLAHHTEREDMVRDLRKRTLGMAETLPGWKGGKANLEDSFEFPDSWG